MNRHWHAQQPCFERASECLDTSKDCASALTWIHRRLFILHSIWHLQSQIQPVEWNETRTKRNMNARFCHLLIQAIISTHFSLKKRYLFSLLLLSTSQQKLESLDPHANWKKCENLLDSLILSTMKRTNFRNMRKDHMEFFMMVGINLHLLLRENHLFACGNLCALYKLHAMALLRTWW